MNSTDQMPAQAKEPNAENQITPPSNLHKKVQQIRGYKRKKKGGKRKYRVVRSYERRILIRD